MDQTCPGERGGWKIEEKERMRDLCFLHVLEEAGRLWGLAGYVGQEAHWLANGEIGSSRGRRDGRITGFKTQTETPQ